MMMTTVAVASTEEVAKFLVEKCRQQEWDRVIEHFYADSIVSVEAMAMPDCPTINEGIEAIKKGAARWQADNDVHSVSISEPIIMGVHFAVTMKLDVTCKMMGNKRMMLEEIAVYEVQNGKIVRQQFFYNTQNC